MTSKLVEILTKEPSLAPLIREAAPSIPPGRALATLLTLPQAEFSRVCEEGERGSSPPTPPGAGGEGARALSSVAAVFTSSHQLASSRSTSSTADASWSGAAEVATAMSTDSARSIVCSLLSGLLERRGGSGSSGSKCGGSWSSNRPMQTLLHLMRAQGSRRELVRTLGREVLTPGADRRLKLAAAIAVRELVDQALLRALVWDPRRPGHGPEPTGPLAVAAAAAATARAAAAAGAAVLPALSRCASEDSAVGGESAGPAAAARCERAPTRLTTAAADACITTLIALSRIALFCRLAAVTAATGSGHPQRRLAGADPLEIRRGDAVTGAGSGAASAAAAAVAFAECQKWAEDRMWELVGEMVDLLTLVCEWYSRKRPLLVIGLDAALPHLRRFAAVASSSAAAAAGDDDDDADEDEDEKHAVGLDGHGRNWGAGGGGGRGRAVRTTNRTGVGGAGGAGSEWSGVRGACGPAGGADSLAPLKGWVVRFWAVLGPLLLDEADGYVDSPLHELQHLVSLLPAGGPVGGGA